MDLTTLLFFVPTCFALNMAPGPNNLLSMSNAKRYGFRTSCVAGIGRLFAFLVMLTLAASGLASVLFASEQLFLGIKILGACYLFWLAYQLWITDPAEELEGWSTSKTIADLVRQEFLLAAGNPKAILIFTAFLPQFLDPMQPIGIQFTVLGAIFLFLEWVAIAVYAYFGVYLRHWFSQPEMRKFFNRSCAGLLTSAGLGLIVARRE